MTEVNGEINLHLYENCYIIQVHSCEHDVFRLQVLKPTVLQKVEV